MEYIEEASFLGIALDKRKLEDEEYIKELIKKIENNPTGKVADYIQIVGIISTITIIGAVPGILLLYISKKIKDASEKIEEKDKQKLYSYYKKSINKLEQSSSTSSGKEKEKIEEIIDQLKKNMNLLNNSSKSNTNISDEEKKKIFKLIEKELTPVIKKYNSKTTYIRKCLDDSIKKFDDIEYTESVFGKYYKSGTPTLGYYLIDSGNNYISISIVNPNTGDLNTALVDIIDDIVKEFKPSNKISNLISNIKSNHNGYIDITFDIEECKKYFIDESYLEGDNMEYIEEGLFDKNPYSKIIKQYKNDKIEYDKKSMKKIIEHVKSKIDPQLKNFKGYKSGNIVINDGSEASFDIYSNRESIDKLYNSLLKIKINSNEIDYNKNDGIEIYNIENNIVEVDKGQGSGSDEDTVLSTDFSVSCYKLYSPEDAKNTNIPVNVIYDIMKKLNDKKIYCNIKCTKGYVILHSVPLKSMTEDIYNDIIKSLKYTSTYKNGTVYIFNPEVVKDINESTEYIEEDAGAIAAIAFLGLIFGPEIVKSIAKFKADKKYAYEVSTTELKKAPTYGSGNEKMALSSFAYYRLNIRNAEKNTLLYTNSNKSKLNTNIYLYKFNKDNLELVYKGSFEDACKKYKMTIKPMNESKLKDRDKIYKDALSLAKQELSKYSKLKSAVRIKPIDDEYDNFINGVDDTITIFYGDLWKAIPNARSDEGQELATELIYNPMGEIMKTINSKLPKNYKVDNHGDWDDIDLTLVYSGKMNESYTPEIEELNMNKINTLANIARYNGFEPSLRLRDEIVFEYNEVLESSIIVDKSAIKEVDVSLLPVYKIDEAHIIIKDEDKKEDLTDNREPNEPVDTEVPVEPEVIEAPVESEIVKENYAVDLDTIQYVSETKNISYKEATDLIMESNNINGIMYCLLPSNINEQISLESFIKLNKSIKEASMIPVCREEYKIDNFF